MIDYSYLQSITKYYGLQISLAYFTGNSELSAIFPASKSGGRSMFLFFGLSVIPPSPFLPGLKGRKRKKKEKRSRTSSFFSHQILGPPHTTTLGSNRVSGSKASHTRGGAISVSTFGRGEEVISISVPPTGRIGLATPPAASLPTCVQVTLHHAVQYY